MSTKWADVAGLGGPGKKLGERWWRHRSSIMQCVFCFCETSDSKPCITMSCWYVGDICWLCFSRRGLRLQGEGRVQYAEEVVWRVIQIRMLRACVFLEYIYITICKEFLFNPVSVSRYYNMQSHNIYPHNMQAHFSLPYPLHGMAGWAPSAVREPKGQQRTNSQKANTKRKALWNPDNS